VMNCAECVRKL